MKKNIRLIIGLLPICCFILMSCRDEDTYDFPGDKVNRVYIQPLDNTVNGSDLVQLAIHKTPLVTLTGVLKIPVSSTLCANGDISVSVSIDNSLVKEYNAKHKTSYQAIPMEAIEMKNSNLKIPSNATKSEGVVEIGIPVNSVAGLSEKEYLMPVKIDEVVGNAVISSNRSIFYAIVRIVEDQDNIWDSNPDEAAKGKLLTADRKSWTVSTVNSTFANPMSNLFDGVTSTTLRYTVSSYDDNTGFTVDMQKEYTNISGIYHYFSRNTYSITSSDIYTSSDNVTWTYQGHFNNNAQIASAFFYVPVKARYIKTIVRANNRTVNISELNIYIKD